MVFGEGFPLIVTLFVYGVPLGLVVWLFVSLRRLRARLDEIQSRLDVMSTRLDAKR